MGFPSGQREQTVNLPSSIQPTLDSLKGKHVGVLQGSTQEAYANETWRSKGVDVVAYANQDLVYSDLAAGRLDAALQDEVAASAL